MSRSGHIGPDEATVDEVVTLCRRLRLKYVPRAGPRGGPSRPEPSVGTPSSCCGPCSWAEAEGRDRSTIEAKRRKAAFSRRQDLRHLGERGVVVARPPPAGHCGSLEWVGRDTRTWWSPGPRARANPTCSRPSATRPSKRASRSRGSRSRTLGAIVRRHRVDDTVSKPSALLRPSRSPSSTTSDFSRSPPMPPRSLPLRRRLL